MQLKSILKSDPSLRSYLLGTFSKSEVAIPLPSLNSHLHLKEDSGEYLFRIQKRQGSLTFYRLLHLLKIKLWIWSLFPLLLVLFQWTFLGKDFSWGFALLGILSVLCFQTSAQLWNDFRDHMVGFDHVHPLRDEKPILQAWVTAVEVRRWAWIWLGVGLGLAGPLGFQALVSDWVSSVMLGGCSLGALFIFGFSRMGWRFSRSAELLSLALFGPLLTSTFSWAVRGEVSWESLGIGLFSGALAFFYLQIRNLEFLLDLSRAGFTNWMNRLGFDKSRRALFYLWILTLGLGISVFWQGSLQVWSIAYVFYAGVLSFSFHRQLANLTSSVGSALQDFSRRTRQLGLKLMAFVFLIHVLEWLLLSSSSTL